MSRQSQPWYYAQVGAYYAWLNGRKTKLLSASKSREHLRKAKRVLSDLLYEARHNILQVPSEQTVASVVDAYLEEATPKLAKATMLVRKPYLQSFAESDGWRKIDECLPDHLQEWLDSHTEWTNDWTKNGALRNVQVAFNWAAKKRIDNKRTLIRENPFRGVFHRTGTPRRDMTEHEFQAILRASGGKFWKKPTPGARFRRVLFFLWLTGCRPCEASALKWTMVDFDRRVAILKEHKTSRTQRQPQPRFIPLHPVVLKLLRWIERQNEGDTVFLTHRKTAWRKDGLSQRLRRAREVAGIPDDVKLYCTRHAFGTRGILNGVDLKSLSVVMGHTTSRTCENYIHLAEKHSHLEEAMLKVNARPPSKPRAAAVRRGA